MPAYNSEKYIGRAIESILTQTHEDLELIIGDDCSTDSTWDIIREYARKDPRIKAFRNDVNSGAAATTNRGVEMATAELIAGMDSDDISIPHRLERQLELLHNQPEVAVVGSYVSHINEHDEILSLSKTGPASIAEFERLQQRGEPTMVFGGTTMYRRRHFDQIGGYDASLRAAADIEFCDRMSELGPIVAIPEALLLYRVYATSNVMLRFREGRRTHRFLEARRLARMAGTPLPTRDQYVASERNMPLWKRFDIWRDDFAQFHYRMGGLSYGDGDLVRTLTNLLMAGIARPIWVTKRLWHQKISPEARRTHNGAG
jgi:glycosyltransferase involved in cell wall biosynthesis